MAGRHLAEHLPELQMKISRVTVKGRPRTPTYSTETPQWKILKDAFPHLVERFGILRQEISTQTSANKPIAPVCMTWSTLFASYHPHHSWVLVAFGSGSNRKSDLKGILHIPFQWNIRVSLAMGHAECATSGIPFGGPGAVAAAAKCRLSTGRLQGVADHTVQSLESCRMISTQSL